MRCLYLFILFSFIFVANGCSIFKPKPVEPEKISIRDIIKAGGYKITVYFDVDSDNLSLITKDSIMRVAKFLSISDTEGYLTGFADKTGKKDHNVTLSEKRVNAVKDYILSLGVPEENIYIDYFGDDLPAVNAETPEAYAKNRRVELLLTSKIEDALVVNADSSRATINALSIMKQRRAAQEALEAEKYIKIANTDPKQNKQSEDIPTEASMMLLLYQDALEAEKYLKITPNTDTEQNKQSEDIPAEILEIMSQFY
ncbi:MAG: OmpA family protein [Endomicrobia bacterium]|nr:OmpA family protein [Endomicrobiia bacterium]MCL2800109.1 OmpA family protein [Endomicrobiia bacterium]